MTDKTNSLVLAKLVNLSERLTAIENIVGTAKAINLLTAQVANLQKDVDGVVHGYKGFKGRVKMLESPVRQEMKKERSRLDELLPEFENLKRDVSNIKFLFS